MRIGVDIIRALTGAAPLGWYTGRDSPNTRRLVVRARRLPVRLATTTATTCRSGPRCAPSDGTDAPHLIVPYTLDANDMRFASPQGFNTGEHFFTYLRDSFDVLYAEGADAPKMMSIGMHCRLLGRPGRFLALQRFLDHVERHDRVWVCRRVDIARHWIATHPQRRGGRSRPTCRTASPTPCRVACDRDRRRTAGRRPLLARAAAPPSAIWHGPGPLPSAHEQQRLPDRGQSAGA